MPVTTAATTSEPNTRLRFVVAASIILSLHGNVPRGLHRQHRRSRVDADPVTRNGTPHHPHVTWYPDSHTTQAWSRLRVSVGFSPTSPHHLGINPPIRPTANIVPPTKVTPTSTGQQHSEPRGTDVRIAVGLASGSCQLCTCQVSLPSSSCCSAALREPGSVASPEASFTWARA